MKTLLYVLIAVLAVLPAFIRLSELTYLQVILLMQILQGELTREEIRS